MSKKVPLYGMLICLSLIFAYVESCLVIPIPMVPGIKLGLANVVTLLAFELVDAQGALIISVLRVLLSSLLFSNPGALLFSMGGCLLSYFAMWLARRSGMFSTTGTGICGGICHNIGQLGVAAMVIQNAALFYYLPILLAAGGICGLLTGKAAQSVLPYLRRFHT